MPRPPELKLQQLQYLVAIAEHGGLRGAAQALGVTAAAVSKGLQELENSAGTSLFERQAQGLQLTPVARKLLTRARLIQAEVALAMEELGAARGSTRIQFTVGITPWISMTLLAPTLQRFTAMRPDVNLRLFDVFGSDYPGLREGTMDLAIGLAPPEEASREFSARPLFSYEHAIACRRNHPSRHVRHLQDLVGQSWLLSHEIAQFKPPLRDFFRTHYEGDGEAVPATGGMVHQYKSMHMMELICKSDLLTVVPWPVIEACRERYQIEALALKERLPASVTCYVTRKNAAANGCVGDFVDAMMHALTEESAQSRYMDARVLRSLEIVYGNQDEK